MARKESWQWHGPWLLIFLLMSLAACHTTAVVSRDQGAELKASEGGNGKSRQDPAAAQPDQALSSEAADDASSRLNVLEEENGHLKLVLLEKEAQIKEMETRQSALILKLDEAIQEVVRAKARLRSLDSRAEAASNMAETEVALNMLKSQRPDAGDAPEFVQAEQLLKMSVQEFRKENYGGALYLAGQAKDQIRLSQTRAPAGEEKRVQFAPGEVPFSLPLDLRVVATSNVREGPGLDYKVIATVAPGSSLKAYAYKGRWVRVEGENRLMGWIFQNLVSGQ